jgi:hypothetical protein
MKCHDNHSVDIWICSSKPDIRVNNITCANVGFNYVGNKTAQSPTSSTRLAV